MERGDARASRVTVEEPIQPLSLDPIPYPVKALSAPIPGPSAERDKRDHIRLARNDEMWVVRMERERQREPVDLNGRHWLVPSTARWRIPR